MGLGFFKGMRNVVGLVITLIVIAAFFPDIFECGDC